MSEKEKKGEQAEEEKEEKIHAQKTFRHSGVLTSIMAHGNTTLTQAVISILSTPKCLIGYDRIQRRSSHVLH